MPSLLLVKGEGCRDSLLQHMSTFMAHRYISLRCNDLSAFGAKRTLLSRRAGKFMSSRPTAAHRKGVVEQHCCCLRYANSNQLPVCRFERSIRLPYGRTSAMPLLSANAISQQAQQTLKPPGAGRP